MESNFKSEIPGGLFFSFPVEHLAKLTYEPLSSKLETLDDTGNKNEDNKKIEKKQIKSTELSDRMQQIADNLNSASIIHNRVEAFSITEPESELSDFIQPNTDMEKQISSIWQKVLGKTKIGLNDNFFEIGGTSLRAVQLIAFIKKDLGINISIVKLFECPTVGLLCKYLSEDKSGEVQNTI